MPQTCEIKVQARNTDRKPIIADPNEPFPTRSCPQQNLLCCQRVFSKRMVQTVDEEHGTKNDNIQFIHQNGNNYQPRNELLPLDVLALLNLGRNVNGLPDIQIAIGAKKKLTKYPLRIDANDRHQENGAKRTFIKIPFSGKSY